MLHPADWLPWKYGCILVTFHSFAWLNFHNFTINKIQHFNCSHKLYLLQLQYKHLVPVVDVWNSTFYSNLLVCGKTMQCDCEIFMVWFHSFEWSVELEKKSICMILISLNAYHAFDILCLTYPVQLFGAWLCDQFQRCTSIWWNYFRREFTMKRIRLRSYLRLVNVKRINGICREIICIQKVLYRKYKEIKNQ